MKYLADCVLLSGHEYRVIADTESPITEIWGHDLAWEFANRTAAYTYIAKARIKTAQDLRNLAPGQEVELTMADGTPKKMRILTNTSQQVVVVDESGQQYNIPHMQPGSAPRVYPKSTPTTPAQSGEEGGPTPAPGEAQRIEPGTGTTYARRLSRLSKKAAFPHRRPQHCQHDGAYLQRKDPQDPEKSCPQCGMVYEAVRTPLSKNALRKSGGYHWEVGDLVKFSHPTLGVVPGKIVRDDGYQYIIRHGDELLAVPHDYILGPYHQAQRKIAQPVPSSSTPTGPIQAPAGDRPQPQVGGPGRPLSRHEIITEAEMLIRNALYKGIRIGVWDLVEYMRQNYSNPPEELYEGATKAWEKVQWEEQAAFERAMGPGPKQPKPPGTEAPEAPMSLADIAKRPNSGPRQVKVE